MTCLRSLLPADHFLWHAASAILAQGLVSAANFAMGVLLLHTAGTQPYAHYVLAVNGIGLLVSLQTAFLGPPLSTRLPGLPQEAKSRLVGALLAEQQRVLWFAGAVLVFAIVVYLLCSSPFSPWAAGRQASHAGAPTPDILVVMVGAAGALLATLRREFLRQALLALRRAHDILGADLRYAILSMTGLLAISVVPSGLAPAVLLLAMATGAVHSRTVLQRALHQQFMPPAGRQAGLLRDMAPLAVWSTSGAALFWVYTQGFLYLVAAQLGTQAVAALAATRLLLMPINLLSSGLGGLLAPAAARWLSVMGRTGLLRRLSGIAVTMGGLTVLWVGALYWLRPVLFPLLFRQPVEEADTLLLAWGAIYVSMSLRDQLGYLLTALGRYRQLTTLTALATLASVGGSLAGMAWLPDPRGAMVGVVAGEAVSLAGTLLLVILAANPGQEINRA